MNNTTEQTSKPVRQAPDAGSINNGQHFTSGPYLTIKVNGGQFSLWMNEGETAVDAALRVEADLKRSADRIVRQLGRLSAYLNGKTVSNPEALR